MEDIKPNFKIDQGDPLRKKRERDMNFTDAEVDRLLGFIQARRHILESRKKDHHMWKEKEKVWAKIEKEFNGTAEPGYMYRNAKKLRDKYDNLKKSTRKKIMQEGGPERSVLTSHEAKVKKLMGMREDGSSGDEDMKSEVSDLDKSEDETQDMWPQQPEDEEPPASPDPVAKKHEIQVQWMSRPDYSDAEQNNVVAKKAKRPIDRLLETRLESAQLQKQLLLIDIEKKSLERKMHQEELEHKRFMNKMQKEEMRLKIEVLKKEFNPEIPVMNPLNPGGQGPYQ